MELFHGTNMKIAKEIAGNLIDVNLGAGEFGKGFYTGDLRYRALNWAEHKYKANKALVTLNINDSDFVKLSPKLLSKKEAIEYRILIKKIGQTKTYLFNENSIWGPVVGREFEDYQQVKFESKKSECLLNNPIVTKNISTK